MGRRNDHWWWFRPPLGRNSQFCITAGPVVKTANIPIQLVKDAGCQLSRPSGWRQSYASLIGLVQPLLNLRWLKTSYGGWLPMQQISLSTRISSSSSFSSAHTTFYLSFIETTGCFWHTAVKRRKCFLLNVHFSPPTGLTQLEFHQRLWHYSACQLFG